MEQSPRCPEREANLTAISRFQWAIFSSRQGMKLCPRWGLQDSPSTSALKTRPIQVDTSQESSAMAQLITQRSQPAIAIGYARRSLRAMAGKSIESGQQTGLRTNGMRRLDCCSFYLPPGWKRLVPEPTRQHTLQCLV